MSKLATKQDLSNIIEKAVKRIKKEQEELIEESLKEAANEAAEKLVLENTITGMVKGVMSEMGGGSGFADNQGSSNTLAKFNKRQEVGEQDDKNIDETKLRKRIMDAHNLKSAEEFKKWLKENP